MRKAIAIIFSITAFRVIAQNPIAIPDTLTGATITLELHYDSVQFLPGIKTLTNGFNQYSYLGPTIILEKGSNVTLDVLNNLDDTSTVHWHGLHIPAMADGGPHSVILPGITWSPQFTVLNNASTFWYHPHLHMKTAQQVMRGAAGLIIVRDSMEALLNLPRRYGVDDFPIIVQSQQYDSLNQILWRGMNDSILLVNGVINPMLDIPSQVVRMRLLNASQERNFNFGFTGNRQFFVIGNDGGLLNAPVALNRIRLSPGERAEILIDVSAIPGQTIYLMSYASEFPMGVQGGTPMPGMDSSMYSPLNGVDFNILQLNVTSPTADPVLAVPPSLVSFSPWMESQSNITRQIIITAQSMMSMDGPFFFNGQLFDMNRIDYHIPLNNIEIWSITNQTMVAHPFHLHGMQFFVMDRDGVAAQPEEAGYKDVVMIAPNETVRFITKFENFADTTMPYMYHCHILMHEDDGMMGQFVVVPSTTGIEEEPGNDLFTIFPNPASNEINLLFSNSVSKKVVVSDLTGREIIIRHVPADQKSLVIDTQLLQGIYQVTVHTKNYSYSKKLSVLN